MENKRINKQAKIVGNVEIRPGIFVMTILCPEISTSSSAGQFCMIRPGNIQGLDPLLRRPLSIHFTDQEKGHVQFLYRVVGRGTRALSRQLEGEFVEVLGPLGRGFQVEEDEIPILVGGGLGVAPLLFLARQLMGRRAIAILGAITKSQLLRLEPFRETGLEILVSTEDGSFGNQGLVTEVLDRLVSRLEDEAKANVAIFSCGPYPMLRAVYHLCSAHGVRCEVSLETTMACGSGLCLGCAVKAKDGGYLHVCKDGPCFRAEELAWE